MRAQLDGAVIGLKGLIVAANHRKRVAEVVMEVRIIREIAARILIA